jgi:hypothetical protein
VDCKKKTGQLRVKRLSQFPATHSGSCPPGQRLAISIDIECTPGEARTLFGLPDVKPIQEALMAQIEARTTKMLAAMEPEALFNMWPPAGIQGLEQWQKFLWAIFSGAAAAAAGSGAKGA